MRSERRVQAFYNESLSLASAAFGNACYAQTKLHNFDSQRSETVYGTLHGSFEANGLEQHLQTWEIKARFWQLYCYWDRYKIPLRSYSFHRLANYPSVLVFNSTGLCSTQPCQSNSTWTAIFEIGGREGVDHFRGLRDHLERSMWLSFLWLFWKIEY